ncbi:hypothetical protein RhiJN_17496 [Ceratobasidium sp. AG-Ba]|nr:hypothetical protein RhiJN_17496 [Ceratobasidium sp. AG-Ba]
MSTNSVSGVTQMTTQRERSNSASSGSSDPPSDNTSSDEVMSDPDSDSDEDMVAALLRPLTPSRHLVDRSGPAPGDVATARGRVNHGAETAPFLNPLAQPQPPAGGNNPPAQGDHQLEAAAYFQLLNSTQAENVVQASDIGPIEFESVVNSKLCNIFEMYFQFITPPLS